MADLTRRQFIQLAGGSLAGVGALGGTLYGQDPYDTLIIGQWANRIRLLQQIGGQHLQENFTLGTTAADWLLRVGRYRGRQGGRPVDTHGYWIFKGNGERKCWQRVSRRQGGDRTPIGTLRYWNEDGRAVGDPEDWELFVFEQVSRLDRTVKIRWARSTTTYVGLVGTVFSCNSPAARAAIFRVEFP
jgi:hypothetical protein